MKIDEIIQQAIGGNTDESKVLYDHYVKELNNILEAKSAIEKLESEVRFKIAKYSPNSIKTDLPTAGKIAKTDVNGYPIKGSWVEKISYFLKKSKDALTAKQILTLIEDMQPELRGKISSSVYPTLSDYSKSGRKFIKLYDTALKANTFRLRDINN